MKIVKENKVKKQKIKNKTLVKPKKERILIVAQEIKFATLLSGNEKKTRDRALKTLKKWILNCFQRGYEFKEGDFTRIWKGLFYAMWMSDKPLVQEELCENIAGILDLFPAEQLQQALLLTKVGLKVLASEWYGIDHHRMDKYLMLVRRYLRASLRCVSRCAWRRAACEAYARMLTDDDGILSPTTPLYARNAMSMILHFTDCYLEELAKVSNGAIRAASVAELLRPFCSYLCLGNTGAVCASARRVLTALLRQSEPGLRHRHKTAAWEQMGCPEGGPDALELVSDDEGSGGEQNDDNDDASENEEDSTEKPLDPRAGRVDVELALLPVPAEQLAATLKSLLPAAPNQQAHRRTKMCLQRFEALSRSQYPLAVTPPPAPPARPAPHARAARALASLEKKLAAESDELALRGLSRKHRKRVLARRRAGESVAEDVAASAEERPSATDGDWLVETEPQPKRKTQDTSNKENVNKTKKKKNRPASKHNVGTELAEQTDVPTEARKDNKNNVNETKLTQKQQQEFKKVKNKSEHIVNKQLNGATKENINLVSSQSVVEENVKKNEQRQQQVLQKNENNKNWKKGKNNSKNNNTENTIDAKITSENSSAKSKNMQKSLKMTTNHEKISLTPKKVKFVLKNNSMQGTIDYYKSVRQSPRIPFDSQKQPSKTNLKPSTPSPINPFFKKKLKLKK